MESSLSFYIVLFSNSTIIQTEEITRKLNELFVNARLSESTDPFIEDVSKIENWKNLTGLTKLKPTPDMKRIWKVDVSNTDYFMSSIDFDTKLTYFEYNLFRDKQRDFELIPIPHGFTDGLLYVFGIMKV